MTTRTSLVQRGTRFAFCALLLVTSPAAAGLAPSFSKTFTPDTIGLGSSTTLVFDIVNNDFSPVSDLAFVDNLPAGVTIADPTAATTDCGSAILSAPAGGGTITFSGGSLAGDASCSISVDVTSADTRDTPERHRRSHLERRQQRHGLGRPAGR